jgi:hypothetical protein
MSGIHRTWRAASRARSLFVAAREDLSMLAEVLKVIEA